MSSTVYNITRGCVGIINTTANVTYQVADATASCLSTLVKTTASSYTLGFKDSFKELAKWSLGVNNIRDGIQALKVQDSLFTDQRGRTMVLKDDRSFPQRVGEMGGNFMIGIGKIATAGAVSVTSIAYTVGSISNFMELTPTQTLSFHSASKATAFGINTLGKLAFVTAKLCAKTAVAITTTTISTMRSNPGPTLQCFREGTRLGVTITGMGAALYVVADESVKAADSQGIMGKIGHGTLAVAGLVGAVAIPLITYTDSILGI